MTIDSDLLDLIGEIYDCAVDPALWPQTLDRILAKTSCDCAGINMIDPVENRIKLVVTRGASPEFSAAMLAAAPINPLMTAGWYVDLDQPFTTASYMGEKEYLGSRFYQEVVLPHGYREAILTILAKSGRRFGVMSLPRTIAHGPPSQTDLDIISLLAPHIRRAVTIADLLESRTLKQDMLSATLDLMTIGVLLVDKDARIVHANAAATRHLDRGGALRRSGDGLSAFNPTSAKEIRDAIKRSAASGSTGIGSSGIAVPISAARGQDVTVWILPLDSGLRRELAAPFSAHVAIFIKELSDNSPFPGELFVRRYKISAAECRLMMMLTQGMTLKEAAYAAGIAETTARTHLQHLFTKTGTKRQVDLVRLVAMATAPAQARP